MSEHHNRRTFAEAIETVRDRWLDAFDNAPTDSPVFVLAAGWRSGSTLLQRILMPECFIWGEPYGHACMLQQLAEPLRCITGDWPEPHFFLSDDNRDSVTERFVANLYPSVTTLLDAHRAYLETMFKGVGRVETRSFESDDEPVPGRDPAYICWGFKEVRLSADYAHYLKLLYPNCKLLFLIRNPYDAYRSWAARRNAGWKWFYRWPDQPVTARLFGRLWCELAGSFVEQAEQLDAHVVRYETLKAGEYEAIESYLGFELNRDAAKVRPADGPQPLESIPQAELDELGDEMHDLAEELEYCSSRMDASSVLDTTPTSLDGRTRRPSYEETNPDSDPARCVVLVPIGGSVVHYGNYGYSWEDAGMELQRYRTFHFHTK